MIAVGDGEEARLTPEGPEAAEITSRGRLPLRVRSSEVPRLRPAFPGTAVLLGEDCYEVVDEREEATRVVYRLRRWPAGEAVRDRVVYGPALVAAVRAEREREETRARARPWRAVLYPLVGSLPTAVQERVCERLGIYAVTATLVSGIAETIAFFVAVGAVARVVDRGAHLALLVLSPLLGVAAVLGLSRAYGALASRKVAGQWLVSLLWPVASPVRPSPGERPPQRRRDG